MADGIAVTAALRTPTSVVELFRVFNRLALQGFGGVLPIAQRELVERERWLTREQFLELLSLGQVLPGPNIVNIALLFGDRHFGWRGAAAAIAGMLLVPTLIVLVLALVFAQWRTQPQVVGALRGMGAVASGLVIATALKLAPTLKKSALGLPACLALAVLTFAGVGGLRWPMAVVVLALGTLACALAWRRLR